MPHIRLKTLKKRRSGLAPKRYMFFIAAVFIISVCIFVISMFAHTLGHSSSSLQNISGTNDKEMRLYRVFEHELQNLNDPFSLFSFTTQKPNPAGVCREIASIVKNGPPRYQEAKRCDLQQYGDIFLSTDTKQQALAEQLQKTNFDELFINNGWQYDDYYKQEHGVTNLRLEYVLGNIAPILQQTNRQGLTPDTLGATYYIKKVDSRTTCRFTESEQPGAKDRQSELEPLIWAKIILNISMICSYDNT